VVKGDDGENLKKKKVKKLGIILPFGKIKNRFKRKKYIEKYLLINI
jgi:hypothetical protein